MHRNCFAAKGKTMRVTKTEKIWLIVVTALFVLYNLPGVPPYGEAIPTLVHAALTVIPLWIAVYVGMHKVYKAYRLKDQEKKNKGDEKC